MDMLSPTAAASPTKGLNPFGLAGVIGWPVAQSRSPLIHNHWFERHSLAGRYVQLPVAPNRLADALRGLPALGFRGCNVTMPHKLAVIPLLDRVSDTARRIGAVNTIIVEPDGTLTGDNTDGTGFIESVRDAQPGWRADAGPVVVLGAGGAARAVVAAMIQHGVQELRLVNRTLATAQGIAAEFGITVSVVPWDQRAEAIAGAVLLVNATSQGMAGKAPLDLDLTHLPAACLVADLIYTPPETALLTAARARGNPTVNGLGMLLHQARPAFQAWFGVLPDVTPELRQLVQATF